MRIRVQISTSAGAMLGASRRIDLDARGLDATDASGLVSEAADAFVRVRREQLSWESSDDGPMTVEAAKAWRDLAQRRLDEAVAEHDRLEGLTVGVDTSPAVGGPVYIGPDGERISAPE